MRRMFFLVFLLVGALTALSCTDQGSAPTESDHPLAGSRLISQCTDPDPNEIGDPEELCAPIQGLIDALYPGKGKKNSLNSAANSKWASIQKSCLVTQNVTDCQKKVLDLIDFGNDKFAEGKLISTEEDLNLLNISLLQFTGFPVPTLDPNVAAEDVVIVVCDPALDCPVVPESGEFGSFLPAGACDGPCVIVGQKIDELGFEPGEGPLTTLGLTDHKQYPVFADWFKGEAGDGGGGAGALAPAGRSLVGAQGSFNFPIEVATCVVDTGAFAPPDPGALKLAHPHPTIPDSIEFALDDPADNVVLDCGTPPPLGGLGLADGRRLSLASPGKLGGALAAFSPVVATDTLPPPPPASSVRVSGFDDTRSRAPLDGGTGFDGTSTLVNALLDPDNFGGAEAPVSCTADIEPLVATIATGSLVVSGALQVEVFFAGLTATTLTSAEATELAAFLNAGGVVYLSGNSAANEGPSYNPLFAALGVADVYDTTVTGGNGESSDPPDTTPLTNGPFGTVGPLASSPFRVLLPATTTGLATGNSSTSYLVAEGAFGSGYLSWMGDPLYFNLFTDADPDNLRYFLNLFARGCPQVIL